jgi:hypothetical protein
MSADCIGDGTDLTPVDPSPIVDELSRSAHVPNMVPTFVIGLPGTELDVGSSGSARQWMSHAAVAGGTAPEGCEPDGPVYCHVDLSSAQTLGTALVDALANIEGQVMSCRYEVPQDATLGLDFDKVRVTLTPSFRRSGTASARHVAGV